MKVSKFLLCKDNFRNIPFDKYDKDFVFIVDGKRYETSRIVADILSPTIRKEHFNDSSFNQFIINTSKSKLKEKAANDYFNDFIQLSAFEETEVDQIRTEFYSEYFYQLGNFDAYYSVLYGYPNEASEKQSIQFLQQISQNSLFSETTFDNEQIQFHIKNISKHFSEIEKNELKHLKLEILEIILKEETLQLEDEDSLLLLINELYKEEEEYSILFEYVEFAELTEKVLKEFIDTFSIEDLNICIWNKICERLIPSFTKSQKHSRTYKNTTESKEFKYKKGEEMNGIIRYLTNKTGGNVHTNQTIEITSNSSAFSYYPKYVVDYETSNGFFSKDVDGTTLCFDFKDKLIQITHYSIKSYNQDINRCHPKNWVAEVSEDGINWIEIDCHINDPTLNGNSVIATFKVEKENDKFYRYFQIRQTGKSWDERSNNFYLGIQCLELYGKLKEPENK